LPNTYQAPASFPRSIASASSTVARSPEHGPGAVARNARQRYSAPRASQVRDPVREVEVRDLAVYDSLIGAELVEAAA